MILPEAFKIRMQKLLGDEYEAFLKSYEKDRAQALRINTLKISKEAFKALSPFELQQVPWVEEGFFYTSDARPGKHVYHDAGLYYIQEPSAMAVGTLAGAKPGERVLDLCAAPGGKSTHLAAAMKGEGLLVCNEIHPARAKILAQNVERMGIRNAVVTNETSKTLAKRFIGFFDRIIVDAPCSGEGMFKKEEQAIQHWSEENVQICAERQQEILENAVKMLRPGGTIVYSTCTFAPEENEGSIKTFLETHPEFVVKKVEAYEGFAPGHPEWVDAPLEVRDTFRLWPHFIEGEGHYVAVLQHQGEGVGADYKGNVQVVDKGAWQAYLKFAKENLRILPEGVPILFGDQLYLLPCELPLSGLKVLRPGLHLGTCKKNRFEPSHALALALTEDEVVRCCALSSEDERVLAYLRGETIEVDEEKGWHLVVVDGYSLGWGKLSSGILKNHYPKGLRRV